MSESAEIHNAPTSFIRRHIFSTDHKVIGKQYLAIALFWMMVGALTIIFIRWQLAWPEAPLPGGDWLSEAFWDGESWIAESLPYGVVEPEFFNKMFTVGSRAGAVMLGTGISRCRQLSPNAGASDCALIPFPAPSSPHAACGFPALRAPARFVPRVMGPIRLGVLSIAAA